MNEEKSSYSYNSDFLLKNGKPLVSGYGGTPLFPLSEEALAGSPG